MDTSWHTSFEGRQYSVQVDVPTFRLEFSSDPLSELCGGGYTEVLPDDLDNDKGWLKKLHGLFGAEAVLEMRALSRTLKLVTPRDFENRTKIFHAAYYEEMLRNDSLKTPPQGNTMPVTGEKNKTNK